MMQSNNGKGVMAEIQNPKSQAKGNEVLRPFKIQNVQIPPQEDVF